MKLFTFSPQDIWQKSADHLINRIDKNIRENKKTLIFLSGGSVVEVYKYLVDWLIKQQRPLLTFAQVDERFDNKNINAKIIFQTGIWDVCKKKNIPYYIVSQSGTLATAARDYDKTITALFQSCDYSVAVLGIGSDGHTAGLLPGYQKAWDTAQLVVGYENNTLFSKRITLTPRAFTMLDYALVVAAGESKRTVIEKLVSSSEKNNLDSFPAGIIKKVKEVEVITTKNL